MVGLISRLNHLLRTHPSFSGPGHLEVVTRGGGNTLAVVRESSEREFHESGESTRILVLANLDCENGATVDWARSRFDQPSCLDCMTGDEVDTSRPVKLGPGQVCCLARRAFDAVREDSPDSCDSRSEASCVSSYRRRTLKRVRVVEAVGSF